VQAESVLTNQSVNVGTNTFHTYMTGRRGRVVSTLASYSGGPGLRSRPGNLSPSR
jgi:hypothetical protein